MVVSFAWTGVHLFDPATGKFTAFQHSDKRESLHDAVNVVCVDHLGMLWLGTQDGLSGLNPATGVFTTYDLGPPNSAVNGILEVEHGNLWLGTHSGLLQFDPRGRVLRRYSVSDGLAGNEFPLNGAVWRSPRGEMLFGSHGGLTLFYPEQILDSPYSPPVRITEIQILGRPVSIGADSLATPTLWWPNDDRRTAHRQRLRSNVPIGSEQMSVTTGSNFDLTLANNQRDARPTQRLAYAQYDRNGSGTDAIRQSNADSNETCYHAGSRTHVDYLRVLAVDDHRYRKDRCRRNFLGHLTVNPLGIGLSGACAV